MLKYFTDLNGIKHQLVGKGTKNPEKIEALDQEYAGAALKLSNEYKCDVFYCVKQFDGIGNFIEARYFAIPIEHKEVGNIIEQFGSSCYIGIVYEHISHTEPIVFPHGVRSEKDDTMSGKEFEAHCAEMLKKHGFLNIKGTPTTGDHGADLLAYKDGELYVIQCKRYSGNVGFKAVQEIHTARDLYHAKHAIVMTNSNFTQQAIDDAHRLGVKLYAEVKL